MRGLGAILAACAALLVANAEPQLVPDISQDRVDIIYSFTGADLLLFGAITYPGGRAPSGDADIAIVLKGPSRAVRVREKGRILGLIWANTGSTGFQSAPEYYAVASSRPLSEIVDERTAAIYELGLGNIQLSPSDQETPERFKRFERGLIELRARHRLFDELPNEVKISKGVLYKARLHIPSRVPVGRYTAETFLIHKGRVLAAATRDIEIRKTGFERFVATSAVAYPFLYGLFAIAISVFLGWLARAVFSRV